MNGLITIEHKYSLEQRLVSLATWRDMIEDGLDEDWSHVQ